MSHKPNSKKYFRNTKTGQLCVLEGSPLAIAAHLKSWRRKHFKRKGIAYERIPEREFPMPIYIGYSAQYNPVVSRQGRSSIRKGLPDSGLKLFKAIINPA